MQSLPLDRGRTPTARVIARGATLLCAGAALAVAGHAATPQTDPAAQAAQADLLMVVDCLLPGQVRSLGQRTTYLSARRPARLPARDCQIRGGEYVAYDRADVQSALGAWLPLAEQGDVEARVIVGEIYERGLGVAPDHAAAARWYRLAADAGNRRAQVNLGHLYETGLGVERDPRQAIEWYRRAAGAQAAIDIDTGPSQADSPSAPPPVTAPASVPSPVEQAELQQLREREQALEAALDELRGELGATRQALVAARAEADTARAQAAAARQQANLAAQQVASAQVQTTETRAEAAAAAQRAATLAAEAAAAEARAAAAEAEAARLAATPASPPPPDRSAEITALQQELDRRQGEARALAQALQASREANDAQLRALAQQARDTAAARAEADAQRARLEQASARLAQQEAELARRVEETDRLGRELATASTLAARQRSELERLQASAQQQLLAGPELALIEPQLVRTRDIVPVVATAGGERQVVGRVTAPAGLMALTVNDRAVTPNELGVFSLALPAAAGDSPVSIVAVDRQGKRSELQFLLRRQEAAAQQAASPAPAAGAAPAVDFGNYHALVIGNNDYRELPDLATPVNDATDVAAVLQNRYGFRTTVLTNASRYEILSALNRLRETLTSRDNLLIYYAGHGELDEVNQRGHWLPVDAERGSTANWIPTTAITDLVNIIQAKQVMLVVDSCYAGALTRSAVGRLRTGMTDAEQLHWLRTMSARRSRTVLTSGGVAPVLDAGGGRHSVFAKALLEVLEANAEVLDGQRLHRDVAARVAFAAANLRFDQVPEYAPIRFAGHEAGEFFLVPGG